MAVLLESSPEHHQVSNASVSGVSAGKEVVGYCSWMFSFSVKFSGPARYSVK